MELMLNPGNPVKQIKVGKKVVSRGEKITVNAKEGKELLERRKFGRALWVEYDKEYTPPQDVPVEEDNSEGAKGTSDKED